MRAGLSVAVAVAVLIARRRESLLRKAEEDRECAYSRRSEKMWPSIMQVNAENVNNYSRVHPLYSTFLKIFTRSKFCKFA